MLAESYEQSPVVTPPTVVATEPQEIPAQRPDFLAREIVETIILTLFIFWMVNTVTGRFRIEGHSMEPTLHEGEYVLINKLSYYLD